MNLYLDITQTRRNLPHWHKDCAIQFVTFHCSDSLPQSVLSQILQERDLYLKTHPNPWDEQTVQEYHSLFSTKVNEYLDNGYGECLLKDVRCSEIMENKLLHFNNEKYRLHAYVIMPNHVHVLVELFPNVTLTSICRSWKSFSALEINKTAARKGQFWHHESWDRMIRNELHYNKVLRYIQKNIETGGVRWMI